MKIFLAGASGAIGKRLVPILVGKGHTVTGTTRTVVKADAIRAQGAEAVVVDGLDAEAMRAAVLAADPDVVVHQMTALGGDIDFRKPDKAFAETNRLRSEATDTLLAAAREAGARRFVAQSFAGLPLAREGGAIKSEDAPFDPDPPAAMAPALAAIRHVETAVMAAEDIDGVVLRYGGFYGPGTGIDRDGDQTEMVRKRQFPLIGNGAGVWSFIHIDDAANATLAAIEGDVTGVFHVVDDEPAPVAEWLPALAAAAGAKRPRRIPAWVARLVAGSYAVTMMTEIRGAANDKAKRELGWQPGWPTWREGFAAVLRG